MAVLVSCQSSSGKRIDPDSVDYCPAPPEAGSPMWKSMGGVPNAEVATMIAVKALEQIYGHAKIEKEKPFHATLSGGVWTVQGTLPKGLKGGVALAEISKQDGRILRISHGK